MPRRATTSLTSTTRIAAAALLFGLVTAVLPGVGTASAAPPAPAKRTAIVALGDSSASGEGAGDYDAGTRGEKGDWCHRSPHAYVRHTGLASTAINLACSGATSANVGFGTATHDTEGSQARRLGQLAENYKVTTVVAQVGANDDPSFGSSMVRCVAAFLNPSLPGCAKSLATQWPARLTAMAPKVQQALTDVRAAMRQAGYQDNSSGYGDFDVAAAKKLLDDDGWQDHGAGKARTKNGQSLKVSYVVTDSGTTDVAEIILSMLGQVGIEVAIQKVPDNDYFEKYVNTGKFDLTSFRQVDQVFASKTIPEYQQPQGDNVFGNFGRIGSSEIDDLMNQAAAETDPGQSRVLYNQADAKIWALATTLPLFETPSIYAVRKDLANEGAWGLADTNQEVDTGWLQ